MFVKYRVDIPRLQRGYSNGFTRSRLKFERFSNLCAEFERWTTSLARRREPDRVGPG